jgi:hypothetical protein
MRNVATLWAAMPETAIHKNSDFIFREINVWVALNVLGVQSPAPDTCTHQRHAKFTFSGFSVLALDGRHSS